MLIRFTSWPRTRLNANGMESGSESRRPTEGFEDRHKTTNSDINSSHPFIHLKALITDFSESSFSIIPWMLVQWGLSKFITQNEQSLISVGNYMGHETKGQVK